MSDKLVVIGSNSFSGAHFICHALKMGAEIIGMSRSSEINEVFLPYKSLNKPAFRFFQFDLNHDLDQIMQTIKQFKPKYVINFSAQSMVGESWQHPEHWYQTNVVSTIKLHDRLRNLDFLEKYVHISTPEVYGSCEGLVKENTEYNPSTPYAVSRAAADMSLMSFFRAYQFPVIFTRAANVYGPGQQLYRIIPRAVLYFLTDKKLSLHGGGYSVRSFIHIQDVVEGTYEAARIAKPGEMFHFSTKENISIRSLVEMIADQLGLSFKDHIEETSDRLGKDSAYLLDSTKARNILGWKDKILLENGIENTIQWVKDNLDELKKLPDYYIHKP